MPAKAAMIIIEITSLFFTQLETRGEIILSHKIIFAYTDLGYVLLINPLLDNYSVPRKSCF